MKYWLIVAAALLSLAASSFSYSQSRYTFEIQPDKKVIYVDSLKFPKNTFVKDVLDIIPELLEREGDVLFPNYDVQYDGKSVGASRDVFLLETRLYQLEKIEISSSPDVEHQRNGQGGVINLVPRPLEEGVGGSVYADVTTEPDFIPGVNVYYKKGKFEMRNHFSMEYYAPVKSVTYQEQNMQASTYGRDTTRTNVCQETAKVDLAYHFTDRDVVKAWLIESWERNRERNNSQLQIDTYLEKNPGSSTVRSDTTWKSSETKSNDLLVSAMAEYEHKFNDIDKIVLNAGYQYNRNEQEAGFTRPHSLTTEMKFDGRIWTSGDHMLKLKSGINCNYNSVYAYDRNGKNTYVSPYLEFKYSYKGLQLNAGARYQYFTRKYSIEGSPNQFNDNHDVTANINALWQIVPHHALRFVGARNLQRPTDAMLYPGSVWSKSGQVEIKGNPNLKNAYLYSTELYYIHDWCNDSGHSFNFNVGAGYERTDGIIETVLMKNMEGKLPYVTYQNSGVNNVGILNLSFIYSYGIFSLAFTGNVFHNNMKLASGKDTYTYFNLNLAPIFQFKHDWTLSGNLRYNSAVVRQSVVKGDCFFADVRLTKKIRNWDVYAMFSDIFDYSTVDYSKIDGKTYYGLYDLYTRYVGIGFNYRFGNMRDKVR